MISIVCVYNDEKILRNWLLKSLENQTAEFELIKIDNTESAFKSAAEALNYGSKKAGGKYIMFIHQDVSLIADDWLDKAEFFLNKSMNLGVAGIAGMRNFKVSRFLKVGTIPQNNGIGNVYHGSMKEPWNCNKEFTAPVEVQTLDELLLIVPRNIFESLMFDEKTCNSWHLYGVDYSLSVQNLNLKSYVLPLPVVHKSTGSLNKDYYKILKKILKKHKIYKRIYTTCGVWHTSNFRNCLELIIMAIKGEIGRWIGMNDHGSGPYIRRMKLLCLKN